MARHAAAGGCYRSSVMSKILVIEDSPEVRERIVASLTFEGFDVVDAEDGEAGLQVARDAGPNLIICDILMPRLDGHATLNELRKDSSTAGIPFIFLSAKSQVSDMREGLQLGVDDYLVKPFALTDLVAAVKLRLRRKAEMAVANNGSVSKSLMQNDGRNGARDAEREFEAEFGKALARGKSDRVRVAVFMIQVVSAERIRRALGSASVATVFTEMENRLSRLKDSGFETIRPLGVGKFAAILIGNRLPMAADEVCEPLFAWVSRPYERDGGGLRWRPPPASHSTPRMARTVASSLPARTRRSTRYRRKAKRDFVSTPVNWNCRRRNVTIGRQASFAPFKTASSKCITGSR